MATEAFVNNKISTNTYPDPANITYRSSTSANAILSYITPGTYTVNIPSSAQKIKVTTVGGGGGGYHAYTATYYGGGGGAVIENILIPLNTTNRTITVVVGAGGIYFANGGNSYIMYNGKQYAVASGGKAGYTNGGASGGTGGGVGGISYSRAPGKGKYGGVNIYRDSGYWGVGGGSWGNGGGLNSKRQYVAPGIGGGGPHAQYAGGLDPTGGDGAVFINY